MTAVLLGIAAAAAIGLGFFSYWQHLLITQKNDLFQPGSTISWLNFFAKGKDEGFSAMEVKLLYELAKKTNMEHPAALFWSHTQMDNCIKYIIKRYRAAGTFNSEENSIFLDKLFEFRKKMEMEKPGWKRGISSTTVIDEMQNLQIIAGRYGTFKSKLLKNMHRAMIIERPDCSTLPVNFRWKGQRVQVYFWRKEDAAYCFESVVSEENFIASGGMPTLELLHNEKIERTQSRSNIRAKTSKSARLFAIDDDYEPAEAKKTTQAGINCCMKDLSDTGCSVVVGGEAKNYFKLLVQFNIDTTPVNLVGLVTAIEYNEVNNTSILHIEADVMPLEIRNLIRAFVFDIIEDDIEITASDTNESEAAGAAAGILPAPYTAAQTAASMPQNAADGAGVQSGAKTSGANGIYTPDGGITENFNDFMPPA